VVDEPRHDVRREQVERVALVAVRAVEREVAVEVALEAQPLRAVEGRGEVRSEDAVVALRVQHDVRERHVELDRDVPPAVRRLLLA